MRGGDRRRARRGPRSGALAAAILRRDGLRGATRGRTFKTTVADPAAALLLVYVEDGASGVSAEVADMTDLSATPDTLRIRFVGTALRHAYATANGVQ